MNLESTLTWPLSCPKDGVHLWAREEGLDTHSYGITMASRPSAFVLARESSVKYGDYIRFYPGLRLTLFSCGVSETTSDS